jgi:hypothetical protein
MFKYYLQKMFLVLLYLLIDNFLLLFVKCLDVVLDPRIVGACWIIKHVYTGRLVIPRLIKV